MPPSEKNRESRFAGSFYPAEKQELVELVNEFLNHANPPQIKGKLKALIVPHAGYIYSGEVAAYGYKLLKFEIRPASSAGRNPKFETNSQSKKQELNNIILLGPSHQVPFQCLALCDYDQWETPLGNAPCSQDVILSLSKDLSFSIFNEAHEYEHSIEVQLPFLQTVLDEFTITPIVTGGVNNHKQIAEIFHEYFYDNYFIIISSDLSHYLPYEIANEIDTKTIHQILNLDTSIDHDQACGVDGIKIAIELAKINGWKAKLLDYRNSGDTQGDKSGVVGYATIGFFK